MKTRLALLTLARERHAIPTHTSARTVAASWFQCAIWGAAVPNVGVAVIARLGTFSHAIAADREMTCATWRIADETWFELAVFVAAVS